MSQIFLLVKIVLYLCFFFFKQKTAYEMRISDWSSDVCSSDLRHRECRPRPSSRPRLRAHNARLRRAARPEPTTGCDPRTPRSARSEEHTSETQSRMRTSYAGFCLIKNL